jgi:hypothetical protein
VIEREKKERGEGKKRTLIETKKTKITEREKRETKITEYA